MAVKYKEYFAEMVEQNKEQFTAFKQLHDKYAEDPITWQKEFNEEGPTILEIIRRYENMLCSKSESSSYGKFSSTLSDKFWTEIRVHFPKIDFIGME